MIKVLTQETLTELKSQIGKGIYKDYTLAKIQRESPSFHFFIEEDEQIRGCCSIWHSTEMKDLQGKVGGAIGHFEAVDERAAKEILEAACHKLQELGETYVIAPIDGSTWNAYRLVTQSDGSQPFLMEPPLKPTYIQYLKTFGFKSHYRYFSTKEKLVPTLSKKTKVIGDITIEATDLACLEEVLDQIYEISIKSFKGNLFYKSIELEHFKEMYYSYKDFLVGELILIAKKGESPIGFIFAVPNYLDQTKRSLVIKTIAVAPEFQNEGIGKRLYNEVVKRAITMGFTEGITALIYRDNYSQRLCVGAKVIREYTLFRKEL